LTAGVPGGYVKRKGGAGALPDKTSHNFGAGCKSPPAVQPASPRGQIRCNSGADSDSLDGRSCGRRRVACPHGLAPRLTPAFPPPRVRGTVINRPTASEDEAFMAEALRLARRIPHRPWPNPPVGAVVVRDGVIVGRGAHLGAGTPHAEALGLAEAGRLARGATLYCTLEPCNHAGRMPPCAPRVVESGVGAVVIAVADPNPGVVGGGLGLIREAGIDVRVGAMGAAALDLIWPFASTNAFARPFVLLKTACSLDGSFSAGGQPEEGGPYLTGIEARRDVHRLRRWADLVLVGERTAAADRPRLDGRLVGEDDECPAAEPMPAYVDTDLSFEGDWRQERFCVFAGELRAPLVSRTRVARHGATVVLCAERDGYVAPEALLDEARARGFWSVLVEGGPTLAASFLDRGLVDRWVCYTAPVVIGRGLRWHDRVTGPGLPTERRRFHLTSVAQFDSDAKMVFDRLSFREVLESLTSRVAGGLLGQGEGAGHVHRHRS
jgi:diaminohydroxyphosphoribosylaminopyrimidine deaminase/5-amino-6-(5-phosphoribosylamino)uracil reductase